MVATQRRSCPGVAATRATAASRLLRAAARASEESRAFRCRDPCNRGVPARRLGPRAGRASRVGRAAVRATKGVRPGLLRRFT
jgi:hypothetical protein